MIDYLGMQFQLVQRIEGQYYAKIYTPGIPLALFFTDDFETEEAAKAAAEAKIRNHQAMTGEQ